MIIFLKHLVVQNTRETDSYTENVFAKKSF